MELKNGAEYRRHEIQKNVLTILHFLGTESNPADQWSCMKT